MRFERRSFAFSNSARWEAVSPLPARLMKYVSIRKPEVGPFGDTLFDASVFAIVEAFFVNSPSGGCVESVLTLATHSFGFGRVLAVLAVLCFRLGSAIFASHV
jgi:hypothetical protein